MTNDVKAAAERVRQAMQTLSYVGPPGQLEQDERLLAQSYVAEHPADDDVALADCYRTDPRNWRDPWLLSVGFRPDDEQDYLFINAGHEAMHDVQAMAAGPWRLADPDGSIDIPRPKTRGDVRRLASALGITLKEGT